MSSGQTLHSDFQHQIRLFEFVPCPVRFWKSLRVEFPQCLWETCSMVWWLLPFWKYFSYYLIVISHVATCVCCRLFLWCVPIIVCVYKFPLGTWRQQSDAPARLLQTKQTQLSSIFYVHHVLQAYWHLGGYPLGSLLYVNVFLVQRSQKLDRILQM